MSEGEALARVRAILVALIEIDAAKVTPEARLVDDLDMDSLDATELALKLEDELDITFPDADIARVETVGDVVEVVERESAKVKADG